MNWIKKIIKDLIAWNEKIKSERRAEITRAQYALWDAQARLKKVEDEIEEIRLRKAERLRKANIL